VSGLATTRCVIARPDPRLRLGIRVPTRPG
jgi:hypothetical protein